MPIWESKRPPLKTNPFSNLIDAYINSKPYVSGPTYDTKEVLSTRPDFINVPETQLNEYLSRGWEILSDDRLYRDGIAYVQLTRPIEETKMETVEISNGVAEGYHIDESGYLVQSDDYENAQTVYFIARPGYTINYFAGVAFQIPSMWQLDEAITYALYNDKPYLSGRVAYIYPKIPYRFSDSRSWSDQPRVEYGMLWNLEPNIAFDNEYIRDYIKPELKQRQVKVNIYEYTESFNAGDMYSPMARNVKVISTIDEINDYHPIREAKKFISPNSTEVISFIGRLFGMAMYLIAAAPMKAIFIGNNMTTRRGRVYT